MSTQTDTIRMALERYNKMKWPQTTDGAPCRDELIAQDALAALSEIEAQPSQTDDLEARAREWWLKTIMLVDETTRPDTKMALSRSASADQATEMLAAFARSLSPPSAPTVDEVMDVVKQWGERYYYEGYLSDLRARLTKLLTNP